MESKKWLFEANGKEDPVEPVVNEEVIEEVAEEVIEEVAEEVAEEDSNFHLGERKVENGIMVYWDGKGWVDRSTYQIGLQEN